MNEQLKCMEMLLRNFLYSLEHCIAPRPVYLGSYCKQHLLLTHSSIFVYNIQLCVTSCTSVAACPLLRLMWSSYDAHRCSSHALLITHYALSTTGSRVICWLFILQLACVLIQHFFGG